MQIRTSITQFSRYQFSQTERKDCGEFEMTNKLWKVGVYSLRLKAMCLLSLCKIMFASSSSLAEVRIDTVKPIKTNRPLVLNLEVEHHLGKDHIFWPEAYFQSLVVIKARIIYPLADAEYPLPPPTKGKGESLVISHPPSTRQFTGLESRLILDVKPVRDVYEVPLSSLLGFSQSTVFLYVVREGMPVKVETVVITHDQKYAQVIAPFQPEDRIVVRGLQKIFAYRNYNWKEIAP